MNAGDDRLHPRPASLPLADRLADRVNPVALEELRQAVNLRFINGMLLTPLAVLLGILVTYAVTLDRCGTRGDGAWLFGVMTSVLGAIAGFGLPLDVGIRLAGRAGRWLWATCCG